MFVFVSFMLKKKPIMCVLLALVRGNVEKGKKKRFETSGFLFDLDLFFLDLSPRLPTLCKLIDGSDEISGITEKSY